MANVANQVCGWRYLVWVGLLVWPAVGWAGANDDVKAAVEKLYSASNYTWTLRQQTGGGDDASEVTGKSDNGGFTSVVAPIGGKQMSIVIQGYKEAILTPAGWKGLEELLNDPNYLPVLSDVVPYVQTPMKRMQRAVKRVPTFNVAADGSYSGDLTPKGAAALLYNDLPNAQVANPKGTVKVTAVDGSVATMVVHLTGTQTGDGPDRPIDRTTSITISDIDHTTLDVPAEAKKALDK